MADPDEGYPQLQQRRREGATLASTLIGLPRSEAVQRVEADGFHPEVISPEVKALSLDLRFERVRIWVDDTDRVIRAHAG